AMMEEVIDVSNLSDIERLPREIMKEIIEYAPESVFDLRLTSRILRSLVDDYALRTVTIPLVDELEIDGECNKPDDTPQIWISVPPNRIDLFWLRLFHRRNDVNLIGRIKNEYHKHYDNHDSYLMDFNALTDDFRLLECLGQCMGRRLVKVKLVECNHKLGWTTISAILEGIYIDQLQVENDDLSEEIATNLWTTINAYSVEHLYLGVRRVKSSDPVSILLELSRNYISLHIDQ
ncbi:hypothetical protein PENTCL1PPCAC_18869, partial [Pristionchus entomophagus]